MIIIRDLKFKNFPLPLQILEITQVSAIQIVCSCPISYIILNTLCRISITGTNIY